MGLSWAGLDIDDDDDDHDHVDDGDGDDDIADFVRHPTTHEGHN